MGVIGVGTGVSFTGLNRYSPARDVGVNFYTSGRNGLTMEDRKGINDVTIMPSHLTVATNSRYAYYADNGALDIGTTNDFTMCVWIKSETDTYSGQRYCGKDTAATTPGAYTLGTITGNYLMARIKTNQSGGTSYTCPATASQAPVMNIAAGWKWALMEVQQSTKKLRLFVNNVQIGSDVTYLGDFAVMDNAFEFCLNCRNNSTGTTFDSWGLASYSDLFVFNKILTPAEKTSLYNRDTIRGAILHIPMNLCTETLLPDTSGNNFHLTGVSLTINDNFKYSTYGSRHSLNIGYRSYHKISTNSTLSFIEEFVPNVPYNDDGTSTLNSADTAVIAAGYTEKIEHPGSISYHNLADSKLVIPVWDRSDAIVYNDNARAAVSYTAGNWYDIANPTHWHITEIARGKMFLMTNINHRDTNFCKINGRSFTYTERDLLIELFSYSSDQFVKRNRILIYTKDKPQLGGIHFKVDDDTNIASMISLDTDLKDLYEFKFNFAINSTDQADLEAIETDIETLIANGHILHNHTVNHIDWATYLLTHTPQEYYDTEVAPQRLNFTNVLGQDTPYYAYCQVFNHDTGLDQVLLDNGFTLIVPYIDSTTAIEDTIYNPTTRILGSYDLNGWGVALNKIHLNYLRTNKKAVGMTVHSIPVGVKNIIVFMVQYLIRNGMTIYTSPQILTNFN